MTVKIRTSSGASGINSIRVREALTTKRAARIKFRTGLGVGDLDQVFTGVAPLSIIFDPASADFVSFEDTTVSGSITANVSGGLAPFSYSWSVLSFSAAATPTLTAPIFATTTVIQTGVAPEALETATLQVVVNDSAGQTATATVPVSFNHITFS